MAVSDLPAMKTNPKFVFFTDFDGTVTLNDSNHWLVHNLGYGDAQRRKEDQNVMEGRRAFRDTFREMMESIDASFNECVRLAVENVALDPHFLPFLTWCRERNIPVVVLSGGMEPVISALLLENVGVDETDAIQIVSNGVKAREGCTFDDPNGWDMVFHDDSQYGHDKSLTLRPYVELPKDVRPTIFFAGDGVSDLSAAYEADLLFAKEGMDLVTYCARENVPFTTFADWRSIHAKVEEIVLGKQSVQDAAKEGFEAFKRSKAGKNCTSDGETK